MPYGVDEVKRVTNALESNAMVAPGAQENNTYFGPPPIPEAPAGGKSLASRMLSGLKSPTTGYVLGKAAQAVMGPYQNSTAAQMGKLGEEMSVAQAHKVTMSKLLAGEDLSAIPESRILAPEQMQTILDTSDRVRKNKVDLATLRVNLYTKFKAAGLEEGRIQAEINKVLADTGLATAEAGAATARRKESEARAANITKTTENMLTPEQEQSYKLEQIREEGNIRKDITTIQTESDLKIARERAQSDMNLLTTKIQSDPQLSDLKRQDAEFGDIMQTAIANAATSTEPLNYFSDMVNAYLRGKGLKPIDFGAGSNQPAGLSGYSVKTQGGRRVYSKDRSAVPTTGANATTGATPKPKSQMLQWMKTDEEIQAMKEEEKKNYRRLNPNWWINEIQAAQDTERYQP